MIEADPVFPIAEAQLTGNFCETLTYGIYLVTCTFCARTLLLRPDDHWRRPSEIRWFLVVVATILFGVSTFDVIIGLLHNIYAFVDYTGAGGAPQELTNIRDWINISRSVTQAVNMVIGDMVLIYRCYVVYNGKKAVIAPSVILYLGGLAMAIKLIVVESSTGQREITLNSSQIRPWWSGFFAITMVQNLLTTALLIYRIWKVEKQVERYRDDPSSYAASRSASMVPSSPPQHRLRKVIRVIAESGLAYTTLVFMTFVASVCNSNALYPLSDATLQATGITFNVIIFRSSPRREHEFSAFDANERSNLELGYNGPSSPTQMRGSRTGIGASQNEYSLRQIQFARDTITVDTPGSLALDLKSTFSPNDENDSIGTIKGQGDINDGPSFGSLRSLRKEKIRADPFGSPVNVRVKTETYSSSD